ncbi:hypothetical protein N9B73_00275 [Verrucomicrobiales bacterium]|nr:hypothetical protein [Verrucomicrobiales bacterium]
MRRDESYRATIRDNTLINVADTDHCENQSGNNGVSGLEEPLAFRCGVHGELVVDGWKSELQPIEGGAKPSP